MTRTPAEPTKNDALSLDELETVSGGLLPAAGANQGQSGEMLSNVQKTRAETANTFARNIRA